jgi:hypothetical protein
MTDRGWRALALFSCAVALACIVYLLFAPKTRRFDTPTIVSKIKPLNQLTTVRYSIQRVIGIREAKQPFGEESLLLMVQGNVLAGVDLDKFTQRDVRFLNDHTIAVHLPAPEILQTSIDEKNTKVWDRQITWWTPWVSYDPDLEHKARLSALDEVRQTALSDGILAQAQKNAQSSIRSLLGAMQLDVQFGGT